MGTLLAYVGTFIFKEGFNYLYTVPHNKGVTTENFWQAGVDWIWDTFFFKLKAFNVFLIQQVLLPMKGAYLSMPVAATFVLNHGYWIHHWRNKIGTCGWWILVIHRFDGMVGQSPNHGLYDDFWSVCSGYYWSNSWFFMRSKLVHIKIYIVGL